MLGGHVANHLTDLGHDVLGVDLRPPSTADGADPGWRHAVADIRDTPRMTDLLTGADAVVHCASALPSYPAAQIWDVIVEGTRSVLTAAAFAGAGRVVHISTTAVYGLPAQVPTPETHPREPVDAYGRAKSAAEEVAEWFRSRGMCVAVLRPKTFLGPGRMGLFAMLFEWAEEGRNFPVLGTGEVRIQMLGVADLVDAVEAVVSAPPELAGDTYNIAATDFDTLRADFQAVLDMAGRDGRVVSLPAGPALAVLGALERTGLSPVYGRLQRKLLADSYVSTDKAHERLGFKPQLSNRDAILGSYAWWRRHHRTAPTGGNGRTSRDAWRQGALSLAKLLF
jgi:nucleoside-diphosphate-sugar epimerase